jgi:hypothetical protein
VQAWKGRRPVKLKDIKQSWIMAGSVVLVVVGLLFAQFVIVKAAGWFKQTRERRITKATDTVMPDHLIARCGTPIEDVTTDVYPVVRRTMRYKISGQRTAVFTFTRTADEPQNWVLLSMKDSVGDVSYETPEAKISALSCLDSNK